MKVTEESSKISLALRFVNWYTSHGQAYERNLEVVDKHLENLAVHSSLGKDRLPYEGNVKYVSFLESDSHGV